jgi:hypothetical protein
LYPQDGELWPTFKEDVAQEWVEVE